MSQTTTTRGYGATLARLATGSLLAGLALTGAAGVASADTPPSGPASTAVALADTPANGATSAALAMDHHGRKDRKEYQKGRRIGLKEGTRDGHRDGLQECTWQDPHRVRVQHDAEPDAYTRGWEDGYLKGYERAFFAHCGL